MKGAILSEQNTQCIGSGVEPNNYKKYMNEVNVT